MDTDNDGIVTYEELKNGLKKFGSHLAESEVQMLIEAVSAISFFNLTEDLWPPLNLPVSLKFPFCPRYLHMIAKLANKTNDSMLKLHNLCCQNPKVTRGLDANWAPELSHSSNC